MKDRHIFIIATLITASVAIVQAADKFVLNPFTGKLDNIGSASVQQGKFNNISASIVSAQRFIVGDMHAAYTNITPGSVDAKNSINTNVITSQWIGSAPEDQIATGKLYVAVHHAYTTHTNAHLTTPPQIFGNPTGARYPKFTGNNNWQWERPLQACVNVFDGAESIVPGPPGAAGKIMSVSATTGAAGSSVSVVNTGSLSEAILGFTIPRGDPGVGIPPGGTATYHLTKTSGADYDVGWTNQATDLSGVFEPKNSNIQTHIGRTDNPHSVTGTQVLPNQSGLSGYILGTNGTTPTWVPPSGGSGGGTPPGGANNAVQYKYSSASTKRVFRGFGKYSISATGVGCLIISKRVIHRRTAEGGSYFI